MRVSGIVRDVRQGKPDNEVTAKGFESADRRTCIFPFFQEIPESRREIFADLDLRRHLSPAGLEQVSEEPDHLKKSVMPVFP